MVISYQVWSTKQVSVVIAEISQKSSSYAQIWALYQEASLTYPGYLFVLDSLTLTSAITVNGHMKLVINLLSYPGFPNLGTRACKG